MVHFAVSLMVPDRSMYILSVALATMNRPYSLFEISGILSDYRENREEDFD